MQNTKSMALFPRTLTSRIMRASTTLLMITAAMSAEACIDVERITRQHAFAMPGDPVKLVHLDLLTVALPVTHMNGWRVEFPPNATPLLRSLSPEQLDSAKQSREYETIGQGSPAAALRGHFPEFDFAAIRAGRMTMAFVNDTVRPRVRYTIDVEVLPRHIEPPVRGAVRKINQQQAETVMLQFYDTLEITLPGKPDEAWNTASATAAGLVFKEKRAASDGAVTLVFQPDPANGSGAALTLTDAAGNSYRFRIQYQATPVC